MKYVYLGLTVVFGFMVLACTGQSLGESGAGQDTYLEGHRPTDDAPDGYDHYDEVTPDPLGGCVYRGAIAVDHRTETAFVLQSHSRFACDTPSSELEGDVVRKILYAVRPGEAHGRAIADLSGSHDTRMLFPNGRVLVMAQFAAQEKFLTFDPVTLELVSTVGPPPGVRYHGTRLSASRRYVAVADNADVGAPFHIFDTETLETRVIPHDGYHLEAQWLKNRDVLVAFVFYNADEEQGGEFQYSEGTARVLAWSFEERSPLLAVEEAGIWSNPILDLRITNATPDYLGSYGWVSVSGNDQYVALPYLRWNADTEELNPVTMVVDLDARTTASLPAARGIAGFSRDSRTLISWSDVPDEPNDALVVVDLDTMVQRAYRPDCGTYPPAFHVTRGGGHVVLDSGCENGLFIFDLDRRQLFKAPGTGMVLFEYVDRTEEQGMMWMVSADSLYGIDVAVGAVDTATLDWIPERVNHLPQRELLVLTDKYDTRLVYFDPETRQEVHEARLEPHHGPLMPQRPSLAAPNFEAEAALQIEAGHLRQRPGFREPICLDCR